MKKLFALLLLCSCTPTEAYVEADRMTYNAIAGEYLSFVGNEDGFSVEQKARRGRLIDSWRMRLEAAEGK